MKINSYIDHTLLAADAREASIRKICEEAKEHEFASVCVNTCWTSYCAMQLRDSDVSVCVVVGFPLGSMATAAKAFEAANAVKNGADEIDMVINLGWLKDGKYDLVEKDIKEVKNACKKKLLKVIIETCLLTDEEKVIACKLAVKAGADYVKTSTGFSKAGAKASDVKLMRETVGPKIGVKAAGGIHDYQQAVEMIDAGATRIGASCGIAIVAGASKNVNC